MDEGHIKHSVPVNPFLALLHSYVCLGCVCMWVGGWVVVVVGYGWGPRSRCGNVSYELVHRAGPLFLDNHYSGYQCVHTYIVVVRLWESGTRYTIECHISPSLTTYILGCLFCSLLHAYLLITLTTCATRYGSYKFGLPSTHIHVH